MTEFHKEELEYIYDHIFKGAVCIRADKHENLRMKLQSMIDNYCEHNLFCDQCKADYNKISCHKCGRIGELS